MVLTPNLAIPKEVVHVLSSPDWFATTATVF